ncbi:MAG: hypothetical protein U9R22_11785 [Pseudomonadota bacterium]|nr:hypothetical protein [Pseudomonadota bacterium]
MSNLKPPPPTPADISLFEEEGGYVFRDLDGLSLYVHDGDGPLRSRCEGACLARWRPLVAAPGSSPVGDWTPFERGDGTRQWAHRQRPVYVFRGDRPGTLEGDDPAEGWHRVEP